MVGRGIATPTKVSEATRANRWTVALTALVVVTILLGAAGIVLIALIEHDCELKIEQSDGYLSVCQDPKEPPLPGTQQPRVTNLPQPAGIARDGSRGAGERAWSAVEAGLYARRNLGAGGGLCLRCEHSPIRYLASG